MPTPNEVELMGDAKANANPDPLSATESAPLYWAGRPQQRYVSIVGCDVNNARNKQSTALRITITPPITLLPIISLARINITLYKNQVRQYLVGLGRTSHFGALIIVVVTECNEITFRTELTNRFFLPGM
jgi:hypothetical protein